MRGHRSAHSLATLVSERVCISCFSFFAIALSMAHLALTGAGNGGCLHLSLGVDNDACRVFKVEEDSIAPAPRLALAHDNGGHDYGCGGVREPSQHHC